MDERLSLPLAVSVAETQKYQSNPYKANSPYVLLMREIFAVSFSQRDSV